MHGDCKNSQYCTLGPPLNMEKSWFHWTFELMGKKPHIPQSLKSLIEVILGRWS